MAEKLIVIWGLTAIGSSLLAAIVAGLKNRHVSHWVGWCFLFPPMLIALFLIPALKQPRPNYRTTDPDDVDWQRIGFDWARPLDAEAHARLVARRRAAMTA